VRGRLGSWEVSMIQKSCVVTMNPGIGAPVSDPAPCESRTRTRTRTRTSRSRFMGSFHDSEIIHGDHEPRDWSAEHRLSVLGRDNGSAPRRCSALRFMESRLFLSDLLTAHEPATAALPMNLALTRPRQAGATLSHPMGEGVRLVRRSLGEGGRTGLRRAEAASATQAGEGRFMGRVTWRAHKDHGRPGRQRSRLKLDQTQHRHEQPEGEAHG
jgi:hypothetical protein